MGEIELGFLQNHLRDDFFSFFFFIQLNHIGFL